MKQLRDILEKPSRLVIGLMSGTSADGVDAALVEIKGCGVSTEVQLREFVTVPFETEVRDRILALARGSVGGSHELCLMSFLLGKLYVSACEMVCIAAGIDKPDIDLIGSHGQTLWHIPRSESYLGAELTGTLQIGEASLLNEAFGCPVASDFRVRDIAAGGQGAPLVPYTEYLLFRSDSETVALQNIGGIGNITLLPKGCSLDEVTAFDTGPGNMIIDALVSRFTDGKLSYDEDGRLAAQGTVCHELLARMLDDDYLYAEPPKTTGRERYGDAYVNLLAARAAELKLSLYDSIATATRFTAECVRLGMERFCRLRPQKLIVGGGGSRNPVLMDFLRCSLPDVRVLTNEDIGLNGDAKEAVAFAVLANECAHGLCSNAPAATGASHPVVLGKLSL